MRSIYLDYNATTPIAPPVQEAVLPLLAENFGDPASHHAAGRAAHEAMEDARHMLAALLGCDRDELVFTSGGTESNNLALIGTVRRRMPEGPGHLVISALEHISVTAAARHLQGLGFDLTVVDCDRHGVVHPESVEGAIRPETVVVSVLHASHEIGSIQPIRQIAHVCRQAGVLLHCDGSQAAAKIPARPRELGADLYTISGHKMYAPKGIGALYVRRGLDLEPILFGSQHEAGLRPGMPNVAHAVGLGRAAALAARNLDQSAERLAFLRDLLESRLVARFGDRLKILAHRAERLPNTLSVVFPEVPGHRLLRLAPDLCAATWSSPHSGSAAVPPTLAAIGLSRREAEGTVRLSAGWYTTEEDVERAADALIAAWESAEE